MHCIEPGVYLVMLVVNRWPPYGILGTYSKATKAFSRCADLNGLGIVALRQHSYRLIHETCTLSERGAHLAYQSQMFSLVPRFPNIISI